jgi:predicted nucleotidyltransferase
MREIRSLGELIARRFRPRRIVLFGSHASGRASAESDVDLLVVMNHRGSAVEKSAEIRLVLRTGFPVDVMVYSPAKVKERLAMGDSFVEEILRDGKVLYEAGHDRMDRKGRR